MTSFVAHINYLGSYFYVRRTAGTFFLQHSQTLKIEI